MKLVRLTSTEPTAYFDNTFNDDITIGANGRVALHSLTTETTKNTIEIDASNETLEIQIQNGSIYQPTLQNRSYDQTNQGSLFADIGNQINELLDGNKEVDDVESFPTGAQVGMMFQAGIDKERSATKAKVFIEYKTANETDMSITDTTTWLAENVTESGTKGQRIYSMKDDETDNYIASIIPLTTGCGHFSAKLTTLATDASEEGVFIGITTKQPKTGDDGPAIADCEFGIRIPSTSEKIIVNYGSENYTSINECVVGDRVGFERYGGIWQAVKYNSQISDTREEIKVTVDGEDEPQFLDARASDDEGPFYIVVIFKSEGTHVKIGSIRWTPNAFLWPNSPSATHLGVGPQNPQKNTQGYLQMAPTLAKYLGYNQVRIPSIGTIKLTTKSFKFSADLIQRDGLLADSFYVELLSLNLNGYDGLTSGRKSILGVIPKSDNDNVLLYQPPTPIFISINNQYETTLRTIRARILNADGSEVLTEGMATLTLLFDD